MATYIRCEQDLLDMLDEQLKEKNGEWWSDFYKKKGNKIPFYTDKPDENLVAFCQAHNIQPKKALDIGCGIGRNAKYLSDISQSVTACDISEVAIAEAKKRYGHIEHLSFHTESIFEHGGGSYDFIYDSGCLHHLPPHKRYKYLELVREILHYDGYFGLVCFNDKPGQGMSDEAVYEEKSMKGGMLYSREKLQKILEPHFHIIEFRAMKQEQDSDYFGVDINWAVLVKCKRRSSNRYVKRMNERLDNGWALS